jgi:integrase
LKVQSATTLPSKTQLFGSTANANCALRTLRRLLHKAEEWKLIRRAPKIKLLPKRERTLRLDDEAERKLRAAAPECKWRLRTLELFQDIVVLVRDTGLRNEKELYQIRIEDIHWDRHVLFLPDSKTITGSRDVPLSDRALAFFAGAVAVEKELTGGKRSRREIIYFKLYQSQVLVIKRAIETAALMLGSDRSRGLPPGDDLCRLSEGANLDNGDTAMLMFSIPRFFSLLPPRQQKTFLLELLLKA